MHTRYIIYIYTYIYIYGVYMVIKTEQFYISVKVCSVILNFF